MRQRMGDAAAIGVVGGLRKAFPLRAKAPARAPRQAARRLAFLYSADDRHRRPAQELRARRARRVGVAPPIRCSSSRSWLEQAIAAQLPEPNAMTLATVGADGRPSTRIVLIKGFDERGIVWFTNYESRKGRELAVHPFAALQFHWVELERVVRIEGAVEKVERRRVRRLLRFAPARFAHRRLGLAAERGDRVARDAARQRRALRRAVHAQAAAAAALGRLSPAARVVGVLAGPQVAPARPPALPPRRRRAGCASASRPSRSARRAAPAQGSPSQ